MYSHISNRSIGDQIIPLIISPDTTFGDLLATVRAVIPASIALQRYFVVGFSRGAKLYAPPEGNVEEGRPSFMSLSSKTIGALLEDLRPAFPADFDLTLLELGGA